MGPNRFGGMKLRNVLGFISKCNINVLIELANGARNGVKDDALAVHK